MLCLVRSWLTEIEMLDALRLLPKILFDEGLSFFMYLLSIYFS